MVTIYDWLLAFTFGYVIPTLISIVFSFVYNKENPFDKRTQSHDWVFMPAVNIICSFVIVYFVFFELPTRWLKKYWAKIKKGFEKWNKE